MVELAGDLWSYVSDMDDSEALAIPTNGVVNRNKEAVMGAGVALQANTRFPDLKLALGALLSKYGNHVHLIRDGYPMIFSFPTKSHYEHNADPVLIIKSAQELKNQAEVHQLKHIYMPRPGCGLGKLTWEEVRYYIAPFFDDRFVIVDKDYIAPKKPTPVVSQPPTYTPE